MTRTVRAGLILAALTLAGCTATSAPGPSASAPATAAASDTPAPPATLLPDGTAQDNLPFFDQTNRATVAANPDALGKDFIDGLVAAGFDKATMQVSEDKTTLGKPVDAIEFAVLWKDSCLLGQFGPTVGGYHSSVQPKLEAGGCLIGKTRAINW
ncbi:DUF6993 domain-containing protein [Mycetocola tolaasinivorans]|uniref:DUF6993 domain-containing protein n=1 Tax=Mycetocola tolaasinivorans TaxID=76635 RepID=UPI001FE76A98|nr:hypothetical protein [Mycetocola tolaasinivorans]